MHSYLQRLTELVSAKTRTIVGLMSGTSLDGLDIVLVKVSGSGLQTKVLVENFVSLDYSSLYLDLVKPIFANPNAPLTKVCEANASIARQHAEMLLNTLKDWHVKPSEIDVIASHGQTVFHRPSEQMHTTLQLGDGDHLAQLTQIITLSDFRQKHIAAGGEGAPLAPYGDYLLFSSEQENRVLLNIGGISNFTYIPAKSNFNSVVSADSGPGNTLMDSVVQAYQIGSLRYDNAGAFAASGSVNQQLLESLLGDSFFTQQRKSTGQEYFNLTWLNLHIKSCGLSINAKGFSVVDLLATLNKFTACSIGYALNTILKNLPKQNTTVYVSGGGAYNPTLMQNLQNVMLPVSVVNADKLGIDASAKEAVLFSVLANQTLFGDCAIFTNDKSIPAVGLGKISMPN